ncbi:MAG: ABC transporter permease [Verrucomicrobia bacterium]|nr:ABC transporter permease [Verrucomicrobiota bacterium]
MNELRFAARQLVKHPGFTLVAVLTLALGIGASTAIYSVVNTVLLNSIPGPAPARLREIVEPGESGVSAEVLAALRAKGDVFTDSAWFHDLILRTKTDDLNDVVRGELVSPNFFSFLHVRPMLGRTFAKDEAVPVNASGIPERDTVIVLNYAWWQSRFAGDAGVIGKTTELSGHRFTIIGVMPAEFQYPRGWFLSFWVPAENPRPTLDWARSPQFGLIVSLNPGIDGQPAQAMLDTVAQRFVHDHTADLPTAGAGSRQNLQRLRLELRSLRDRLADSWRADDLPRTLYGLLGAIGFVLLIVCLNLGNLMLVRTERRRQELAVRSALGASRIRLARQLVTETVLLASLGGGVGLIMTVWFRKLFLLLLPPNLPRFRPVEIDRQALVFTLLVCAIIGVAYGLALAWQASRTRINEALKQGGAGVSFGRNRFRRALVVMEVALSLVLLAGAGLMIQSVVRLLRTNVGFDPDNLVYLNLWLPSKYSDSRGGPGAHQLRNALLAHLQERFTALPGVKAVGIFGGDLGGWKIQLDARAEPVDVVGIGCGVGRSDCFRAMHIPLRAGRYLDERDGGPTGGAVIINEAMARLCWPNENALGRKFHPADSPEASLYQVVGIVADTRPYRYTQGVAASFYRPYFRAEFGGATPSLMFVVRAESNPRPLIPAFLRELKAAEPDMIHPRVMVARTLLDDSTQAQRTFMVYLVGFAGIGLLLSALGVYGVLAYSVARRTREIGIRLAVGGQRRDVLGLVLWEGARLVGVGAALGLLGAFWLLQLVKHWVFEATRTTSVEEGPVSQLLKYQLFQGGSADLPVWSGAVLLLLAVALLACYLPARRATQIDPMEALRCE